MMRLGIAADHGGFELKKRLTKEIEALGCDVKNFGAFELDPGDDVKA